MKQFLDLCYNIPTYGHINVGDIIASFNAEYANDRSKFCHCHLLQVIDKEARYAKLYVKSIRCYCDDPSMKGCNLEQSEINYTDMKRYSHLYRMIPTAAQVLFGESK
jgi:hypothetical protein